MKTIDIDFSSYRPRLKVGLTWTNDLVPNVGDEIRIESKFISQLDTKYFPKWMKDYSMTFKVKKRFWNLGEKKYPWTTSDVSLELDWTDEEQKEVDKYLKKYQKERGKKKILVKSYKVTCPCGAEYTENCAPRKGYIPCCDDCLPF